MSQAVNVYRFQVKIWFQNRRSKCKKLRRGGGSGMMERSSEDNDDNQSRDLSEPNSVENMNNSNGMSSNNEENGMHVQQQPQPSSIPPLPIVTPQTPNGQANVAAALVLAQNGMPTNIPASSALAYLPTPGPLQPMGFMPTPLGHPGMMGDWHHHQQSYMGTKLEEPFEMKNYHFDPYYQQQFTAAATQYSAGICPPPHNFEY